MKKIIQFLQSKSAALFTAQSIRLIFTLCLSFGFGRSIDDAEFLTNFEWMVLMLYTSSFFWLNALANTFFPMASTQTQQKRFFSLFGATTLLLTLVATVIVAIILGASDGFLSINYYYLGFFLFHTYNSVADYVLIFEKKSALYYTQLLIYYGLLISILFQFVILHQQLDMVFPMLFLVATVRGLFLIVYNFRFYNLEYIKSQAKEYLKSIIYLGGSYLVGGSRMYIDSYFIKPWFGGINFLSYQYGGREFPLSHISSVAISQNHSGEVAKLGVEGFKNTGAARLKKDTRLYIISMFTVSAMAMLVSDMVFGFLLKDKFPLAAQLFDIMLLLVICRSIYSQTIMLGLKENKAYFRTSIGEFAVNILFNIIGGLIFGIHGIVVSTFIAYLFEKLYFAYYLNKKFGIKLKDYLPIPLFIFASLGLISILLLKNLW